MVVFVNNMSTTRVTEGLAYGFKLCVYWLGVVLVGGGGIALGGVLAEPEVSSWRSGGSVSTPELAGGLVLAVLGLIVLVSGLFGLIYKLLVDSIAAGTAAGLESGSETDETIENATEATAPSRQAETEATARQQDSPESGQTVGKSPAETVTKQLSEQKRRSEARRANSDDLDRSQAESATGATTAEGGGYVSGPTGESPEPTAFGEVKEPERPRDTTETDPPESVGGAAGETPTAGVDQESQPQPSAEEIAFGTVEESGAEVSDLSPTGSEPKAAGEASDVEPEPDPPAARKEESGEPSAGVTTSETAGSQADDPLADQVGNDET
jgi:hypothetical protein